MLRLHLPGRMVAPAAIVLLLAAPAAAQNGRIFGTVTDEDGEPLKGASVTAQNPTVGQTLTATTDAKGHFAMIALRGGAWEFAAAAPGYTEEHGTMLVRLGSPNRNLTFILRRNGVADVGALGGVDARNLQADFDRAERLFAGEQWDEAIAAYRTILERAPVLTSIRLQIGAAYRRLQKPDDALAAYRELLELDPGNARATVETAATLRERGDTPGARAALARAIESGVGTRDASYLLGELEQQAGDPAEAARWFQKAADTDPNWAKPLLKLGEQALARGETEAATRFLMLATEVDPEAPEARTATTILQTVHR